MNTPIRKIVQKALSPSIFKAPKSPSFLDKPRITNDIHLARSSSVETRTSLFSGSPRLPSIKNNIELGKTSPSKYLRERIGDFIIHKPKNAKSSQKSQSNEENKPNSQFLQPPKQNYIPSVNTPERHELLEADLSSLNLNILGKGSFGIVVLATYKGKNVAVKIIPRKKTSLLLEENSVKLHHPNILKVLSAVHGSNYNLVIMKTCCSSDVQNILDNSDTAIPFQIYSKWILDICAALQCCHQNRILHLDVKPKNILVRENNCLLCDFGNSLNLDCLKQKDDYLLKLSNGCVGSTVAYSAPELLYGFELPTTAADVYALGITMCQIYTRMHPYQNYNNPHTIIYQVVKHNLRPEIPNFLRSSCSCVLRFCELYQRCWSQILEDRPGLQIIAETLRRVKEKHEKKLCSEFSLNKVQTF